MNKTNDLADCVPELRIRYTMTRVQAWKNYNFKPNNEQEDLPVNEGGGYGSLIYYCKR